ncbi:MAG: tetratricopeptide repeat protein [Burkholderiales bacterium]
MAVRFSSFQNPPPRRATQRAEELLARAIVHHGAGQLAQALELYRQILRESPGHAKAQELAGICCMQAGSYGDAAAYLRTVLKTDPDNHTLSNNLGVCLQHLGDFAGAAEALRHSIRLQPNYPEAHNNLGSVLEVSDRISEAVSAYLKVIELAPEHRAALVNLKRLACDPRFAKEISGQLETHSVHSIALRELLFIARAVSARQQPVATTHPLRLMLESAEDKAAHGDAAGAIEEYQHVVEQDPRNAAAWNNLGLLFRRVGDYAQALAALARATQINPDFALAWNSMGSCYLDLGDLVQARTALERAKSLAPAVAGIECNLGMLHRASQDATQAMACYERALGLDPNLYEAHLNLGNLRNEFGDEAGARAAFGRAVELAPQSADAHYNLAVAQSAPEAAMHHFNRALALKPVYPEAELARLYTQLKACDWNGLSRRIARVSEMAQDPSAPPLSPFWFLAVSDSRKAQQQCARKWAQHKMPPIAPLVRENIPGPRVKKASVVRVGFLSGDLRQHAVGELLRDVLPLIDSRRCELFAYDTGPNDGSSTRQQLLRAFRETRLVATLSTHALANTIAADDIDLLVDLSGYTQHSRSQVLALRPAPVQVSYLGFPGTMGWSAVDYLLADDYLVPALHGADYDERIVRLPHCYQPARHFSLDGENAPAREALGLPKDGVVFACFGNAYKLRPEMFDCWLRILRQVPGSVLWFARFNDTAENALRAYTKHRGVDPARLVFSPIVSLDQHTARLPLADLFLDTAPYGSGMTAAQTLYAGVPLLTVSGRTYAGRMAASVLHALGMDSLIATDVHDYEARAVRLARDPKTLNALRQMLAVARVRSSAFDIQGSARDLENVFLRLAQTRLRAMPLIRDDVSRDELTHA